MHQDIAVNRSEHTFALVCALREMVYETTHLSPVEDDGSHWCRISAGTLAQARAAIAKATQGE